MTNTTLNSSELLSDIRKVEYLSFLATAKQDRGKTQKEFAKEIQVSEQTLCEWKKAPGFQEELLRRVREQTACKASDITGALEKKALSGDVAAIRLWLEFAYGWSRGTASRELAAQQVFNIVRGHENFERV
jgi:hypothetical protein